MFHNPDRVLFIALFWFAGMLIVMNGNSSRINVAHANSSMADVLSAFQKTK
jgi:hypothetical protein